MFNSIIPVALVSIIIVITHCTNTIYKQQTKLKPTIINKILLCIHNSLLISTSSYFTHEHIQICAHMHMHTCMSVYIPSTNACTHIHTHTHTHTLTHTYMCVCIHTSYVQYTSYSYLDMGAIFITIQ